MKLLGKLVAGVGLIAALAGLIGPSTAQENSLERIRESGKIIVALEFGRPPWGFKDENLNMTGYDMEVAKLLAEDLGVELQITEVTGPTRAQFLLGNRTDVVISTFAITPDRQEVVDFSVPYASLLSSVAAPKDMNIANGADLAGLRVGVTRASTSDMALTEQAPDAEIVRFDDESTTNTALTSGQLDVIAGEPIMLLRLAERNPEKQLEEKFVLSENFIGVGLRKNEPELKAWVDDWVRENLRNGRLDALFNQFFGIGLSAAVLEAGNS